MPHNSHVNITCFEPGSCSVVPATVYCEACCNGWDRSCIRVLSWVCSAGYPGAHPPASTSHSWSAGIKGTHCHLHFTLLMCWELNSGPCAHQATLSCNPSLTILSLCIFPLKAFESLLLSTAGFFPQALSSWSHLVTFSGVSQTTRWESSWVTPFSACLASPWLNILCSHPGLRVNNDLEHCQPVTEGFNFFFL